MKKKILVFGAIIILLAMILAPCSSAILLKEKKIESTCLGSIYGNAGTSYGWGFSPVGLVKIEAEGRTTYSSPIMGTYKIKYLPLGAYTITGTKTGYDTFTDRVALTKDRPDKQVFIHMEPNDKSINKAKTPETIEKNTRNTESEEPARLGSIWGNTGEKFDTWGFSPVGLVKVEAGGKTTYSSPILGCYKIRNLPVGTYTVTGTKRGYDTFTDTVKLTEERPDKQVFIHMEPNDESVNRAKPGISNLITEKISESLAKAGFGIVLGSTMWQKNWGMGDLPYVKVEAIGQGLPRVKNSGPFARFTFVLPLDRTYTIYGSKTGYDSDSESVTLTSDDPLQFVDLVLKGYNKNANIKGNVGLFASTLFSSNTGSYFFSTLTFMP